MDNYKEIFSEDFLNIDTEIVSKNLEEKGYFSFPKAISDNAIRLIEKDATNLKLNLNNNEITGVHYEHQYYFTNLLTVSKTFYNFITSTFVFEVCKKYLGNRFRLKALRYYETFGGHHMQWHTDNKTDRAFAHIPGIIFIFYISDVDDGEFQYIEGSHLWSGENAYSNYDDEFIQKNYKGKIKSFKFPRGSLIIYNTYGIHRAKPVLNKKFVRKSVFFQVDTDIEKSEPIILNTKFISKINSDIEMFLGFGKPSDSLNYKVYPDTNIKSLPLSRKVLEILSKYLFYRLKRYIYSLTPHYIKYFIKKLLKK